MPRTEDELTEREAQSRFAPQSTIERCVHALKRWRDEGREDLVRRARQELARMGIER